MRFISFLLFIFISQLSFSQKAVLLEEGNESTQEEVRSAQTQGRIFQFSNRNEATAKKEYSNTLDLRSQRRVGVGINLMGQMGLLGAFAELNFGQEDSTIIGLGTGGKFNSIHFQWKHIWNTKRFSPYFTVGYSRWYSSGNGGHVGQTNPSFLSEKLLTEYEKETGRFGKDLIIPSLGLQYFLLNGPYAGASLYTEIMVYATPTMIDSTPNGTLGMIYYF